MLLRRWWGKCFNNSSNVTASIYTFFLYRCLTASSYFKVLVSEWSRCYHVPENPFRSATMVDLPSHSIHVSFPNKGGESGNDSGGVAPTNDDNVPNHNITKQGLYCPHRKLCKAFQCNLSYFDQRQSCRKPEIHSTNKMKMKCCKFLQLFPARLLSWSSSSLSSSSFIYLR